MVGAGEKYGRSPPARAERLTTNVRLERCTLIGSQSVTAVQSKAPTSRRAFFPDDLPAASTLRLTGGATSHRASNAGHAARLLSSSAGGGRGRYAQAQGVGACRAKGQELLPRLGSYAR